MVPETKSFQLEIGGKTVTVETGKYAQSTNGSVTVRCGDTMLFVHCVVSKEPRVGIDFFPLLIDYEERMSSIGRIPGGYNRSEGKASDKAILVSRLIDRPIRPLFPKGYRNDIQIVAQLFSYDQQNQPDTLAMLGASCALMLSGAPFEGPIGAVRVSKLDGQLIANPTHQQADKSDLDIVVAGTHDSVIMVEAGCKFVTEDDIMEAVEFAQGEIRKQCDAQVEFAKACGVVKEEFVNPYDTTELKNIINEVAHDMIFDAYHNFDRKYRQDKLEEAKKLVKERVESLPEDHYIHQIIEETGIDFVAEEFKAAEKKIMRAMILDEGVRADGRKPTEVRPIWCEVGVIPRAHGSAVFTRGQTQVLSVATLAPLSEIQKLDGIDLEETKRYIHQYNFPAYSVGETKVSRGPGRREIGHGALAEKALMAVLPSEEEFPYAIRAVSETFESNGSTSMASTCASCMALMAAGVPIKKMVAGISCGLVTGETDDDYIVLTDIQGLEDFFGDMDFKVTGTHDGITAIQMDIKIHGLTRPIVEEAIRRTREARLYIMDEVMSKAIAEPRKEVGQYAPKILQVQIDPAKIGDVVGQKGKTINEIIDRTGVKIDINDEGAVSICGTDKAMLEKAADMIRIITTDFEEGQIFTGKVVSIKEFGAFIEFAPGKEGMVHISKIAKERIEHVEDVLTLGDTVTCICMGKDRMGRISFSIKDVPAQN